MNEIVLWSSVNHPFHQVEDGWMKVFGEAMPITSSVAPMNGGRVIVSTYKIAKGRTIQVRASQEVTEIVELIVPPPVMKPIVMPWVQK